MKKMSVIIVVLGIAALFAFAGCKKQEAPTAPASAPTGTAVPAPTATAPAK